MTDDKRKLFPKSSTHKAERSDTEWKEYHSSDSKTKKELDKEYKKREDSQCQEPGCPEEAVHQDKRSNKSGKCLHHWDGDSDDNG